MRLHCLISATKVALSCVCALAFGHNFSSGLLAPRLSLSLQPVRSDASYPSRKKECFYIILRTLISDEFMVFNLSRFSKKNRAKLDLACFLPRAHALGYQEAAPRELFTNSFVRRVGCAFDAIRLSSVALQMY